jgi:archaetidylinositol phosphate synthase
MPDNRRDRMGRRDHGWYGITHARSRRGRSSRCDTILAMTRNLTPKQRLDAALAPLGRRLSGVHPDVISVAAAVVGCASGVAYAWAGSGSWLYLVGGVLVIVSGLLDGLDGVVARLSGRTSRWGDFLDHFLDRVVEIAILIGLAVSPGATTTFGLGIALIVVLNSYLGTQIHASFEARSYEGLGKAQFVVFLLIASVVLWLQPDIAVDMAGISASGVDIAFAVIGVGSLLAIAQRLAFARRLSRRS